MSTIDNLRNWDDIKDELFEEGMLKKDSPCLLIGNGASIAVSEKFRYDSLYEKSGLSVEDRAVFDAFETTNFESVLRALSVAKVVNTHLEIEDEVIDERYEHIRDSLIDVVGEVHPDSWEYKPNGDLKEEYLRHKSVYSTNYDLLLYWSMLSLGCVERSRAVDMFYENTFNSLRDYGEESTRVYYLHGALHLYIDSGSDCRKLRSNPGARLLDQIRSPGGEPIHFVSEGTWQKKREAIKKSVYLQYVFDE